MGQSSEERWNDLMDLAHSMLARANQTEVTAYRLALRTSLPNMEHSIDRSIARAMEQAPAEQLELVCHTLSEDPVVFTGVSISVNADSDPYTLYTGSSDTALHVVYMIPTAPDSQRTPTWYVLSAPETIIVDDQQGEYVLGSDTTDGVNPWDYAQYEQLRFLINQIESYATN